MSDVAFEAHEVARSFELFSDPRSYRPFDLTADHMRIVGCIDPRDEDDPGVLKTIVQTGGGAAGSGLDASLSLTAADDNNRVYLLEEGLRYDSKLHLTTVAGGHNNTCRFIHGLGLVAKEITAPSDFTDDTMRRFVRRYELDEDSLRSDTAKVIDATKRSMDVIESINPSALLGTINSLYPYHPNVREMRGGNRAGFYIMNHHPHVGLDRMLVHRGDNPLTVHAYHDNPRAMMDSLAATPGMPGDVKRLRLSALLLRTAATRSVLCSGGAALKLLDVVPTRRGLQVQEVFA